MSRLIIAAFWGVVFGDYLTDWRASCVLSRNKEEEEDLLSSLTSQWSHMSIGRSGLYGSSQMQYLPVQSSVSKLVEVGQKARSRSR